MLYFSLGAMLSKWLPKLIEKIRTHLLLIISVLALTALTISVTYNFNRFYVLIPFSTLLGIVSVIFISKILDNLNWFSFLRYFGKYSLEIFVAHTIASSGFRIIFQNLFDIVNPGFHLLGGLAAGIIFPLLLVYLFNKFNIKYVFNLKTA
jgi:hypothetical protein